MSSGGSSNLDLTTVDTNDLEKLTNKINTYYQQDSNVKSQLSWHWDRNHLMLDGKQWIVFNEGASSTGGQWQKLKVSKQNEYIPRPVTNYIFSIYQTLKSYLIKNKPRSKVYPNTYTNKDKTAAKISTLCLEANWARLKEEYNYESAAASLITYGTVFKKSYWDTSSLNLVKVPKMKTVPITDPNTGMEMGSTEEIDYDPITGDMLTEELPIGDVNTAVVEPQRMALDPLAMHLHDARWIMEYTIQPLDWIRETYSKEGDGYTGLADQVEEEKDLNGSLRRWYQLRTTSGLKLGGSSGSEGMGSSDGMVENCAVVKEYYERPTSESPKGRLIVIAGDKCVYSGDSPYDGPELGDWHPYSECRWELVPGRFWGKSPLDEAVEIQKNINSIDSVMILIRKTMAIPQKLIPRGVGVEPGSWTGRPAQEVYYRPDGSGAKPETIPSSPIEATLFQERAQRVEDIKELSGAIDILRGDRPPGVNAASALSLLYEVGTGKIYPVLDRWKKMIESDQKKQLRMISKRYKEPRPDFIRMLRMKNTQLSEEEINNFIGTDLYDNCNAVVEAGSNIPKLEAAKEARLMELAQGGTLNLQDPSNRAQFLQDMGVTGYDDDIEPDKERASWENDLMDDIENSPDNKPVVLDVDNDSVHIAIHSTRMKARDFMAQPTSVQQAYMQHLSEHEASASKKQQAQMLQQQAMAPSPGAPVSAPPKAGTAQPDKTGGGHGKGLDKQTKQSVFGADINTPANLGNGRAGG